MPALELDHGTLSYEVFGAAENPGLFLIHGLHGDSESVRPIAERLAKRFHVIAPDMLGHGESERLEEFTLDDQAQALTQLMFEYGYRDTNIVGYSMGSYIAARAAALAPEQLERLVLVAPKPAGTTSSTATAAENAGLDPQTASADDVMAALQQAIWSESTDEDRRREIMSTVNEAENLSKDERERIEESVQGFDLREHLPSITARTLVLSGADDGLNPPKVGREVAELIPHAEFRVYERSGHMLPYEETDRFVEDVTEFIMAGRR